MQINPDFRELGIDFVPGSPQREHDIDRKFVHNIVSRFAPDARKGNQILVICSTYRLTVGLFMPQMASIVVLLSRLF